MAADHLILDRIYEHEAAQRDVVFMTQPIGSGQVEEITWGRAVGEARRIAAYMRERGLQRGDRVAMLAKNSAHFIIAEMAIWIAGGTTVAIFPTESAENARYVMEHSEASLLFVGRLDTWEQQRGGVPAGVPCIALPLAPAACAASGCVSWHDIVSRTAPLPGRPARDGDDLAMILYTSGSTGQPKGVMQSFGSITRRVEAGLTDMDVQLPEGTARRILSYLPLAHAYERGAVECPILYSGDGHIFFADTLASFADDLRRARPTVFVSVPRLWLKFQQGVLAAMPAAQLDALLDNPATSAAVGRKVLAGLGLDEVRLAVSGSAPISVALLNWYRRLGLNLVEGYGMTEDFAYSHRTTAQFCEPGYVGVPSPGVQVRLDGDGEILIKSPGALVGYYKRPDLNAECFTKDGFFRTGDLGEQRSDGQLRITGRKKELFKTAKGKYVAPAPIENRLNAHPMIEQSMVSGVGQPAPYAMVMLNEYLRPRLSEPDTRRLVEADLAELLRATNESLVSHERLCRLVITSEPWSIENGCLTPTMKIKRSRLEAMAEPVIGTWYAAPGPVVWA
ncbi:MAG TPA: AMP-binding protein [Steroidobacteraceae bacterium]|jgi:long-chain acyl-CoA synthetase